MAKQQVSTDRTGNILVSSSLLVVAYATYGKFLHSGHVPMVNWVLSVVFAIALAGMMTIHWVPSRRVILLGFKSDLGYFIMVLGLASAAVFAVVQFRVFSYIVLLVAVSLLTRVDTLILNLKDFVAFLLLTFLAFIGLAISWVPFLLVPAGHHL